MLRRPIVTYHGDHSLFMTVQKNLAKSLPQESVEWRRSFGRPTRCVHVEVDFVPFSEEMFSKEQEKSILGHPVFHTFWTDCPDVETYKGSVREILTMWVHTLKQSNIQDWMVILVEAPDVKKSNKLIPRTTVLDKLKSDFGGKQSERCLSLIDPSRSDSRSIESWQLLMTKMRHLLMIAYNRALNRFEEVMRAERERRTEKAWTFCKYFILQEELAQVFNLLALYDEALVQYDELDALFTQFVLNSAAGDVPYWLSNFSQPCEKWEGLHLSDKIDSDLQEKIRSKSISLIEFRNYLFQCQSALLIKQNKPWDLAARSLVFLQNTLSELRILDVNIVDGGVACWGFLSSLEIIRLLSQYKNPATTDSNALHTSPLWAYARDKLKELGQLCGLMPGKSYNSEQMHMVITLVCGMGNDPHSDENLSLQKETDTNIPNRLTKMSPMTRLKEALSSREAFKKHFLDLSEVAISTYKHIGRIRSARLIGRDLALFYMKEGSVHLATSFLTDQLKTFLEEGWHLLAAHTLIELTKCHLDTNDNERYMKTCLQLTACPVDQFKTIRVQAFEDMMKMAQDLNEETPLHISCDRIFEVGWMKIVSEEKIILGSEVEIEMTILSQLPTIIKFESIDVQLKHTAEKVEKPIINRHKNSDVERKASSSSTASHNSLRKFSGPMRSNSDMGEKAKLDPLEDEEQTEDKRITNPYLKTLEMNFNLDYKQDKSLSSISVHCKNAHKALRREDSHGGIENMEKNVIKESFASCLSAKDVFIHPDENFIRFKTIIKNHGLFNAGQVVLTSKRLVFVCNKTNVRGKSLVLEVVHEKPQIFLGRKERELLAGICQPLILTVKSGSSFIKKNTILKLKCSRGLTLQLEKDVAKDDYAKEIDIELPEVTPFNKIAMELLALTQLYPQKEVSTIEHNVSITSEVLEEARIDIDVHFIPPFVSTYKLFTATLKKFIQVTITGLVKQPISLSDAQLVFVDEINSLPLTMLNPEGQQLIISSDQGANYMWELDVNYSNNEVPSLKAKFSVNYQPMSEDTITELEHCRPYVHNFEVTNYKTLYNVRAKVDPSKGSEFCRARNMCHLSINLQQVDRTLESSDDVDGWRKRKKEGEDSSFIPVINSIMYEVITDPTMWAVCERTSGVLSFDNETNQNVVLDVMPLIGGFLPLPSVRLSKYIPAETKRDEKKQDIVGTAASVPRLEPFSPGQVYNFSKALQVHVLPPVTTEPSTG